MVLLGAVARNRPFFKEFTDKGRGTSRGTHVIAFEAKAKNYLRIIILDQSFYLKIAAVCHHGFIFRQTAFISKKSGIMGREDIPNGENTEKTQKDLAVERLSKDNRNWLKGWEKDGWMIDLIELEWYAEKKFDGDDEKTIITGFGSVVLLLTEIERIESQRKMDDVPELEFETPEKVEPQIVIRECRIDLNDDELKDRTSQMMLAMDERDEAASEFESLKDAHKANMKTIGLRIQMLRHTVNTRVEWRSVECKEVFNYETFTVTVVRSDNGEIVEKRPMTQKERQSKPE